MPWACPGLFSLYFLLLLWWTTYKPISISGWLTNLSLPPISPLWAADLEIQLPTGHLNVSNRSQTLWVQSELNFDPPSPAPYFLSKAECSGSQCPGWGPRSNSDSSSPPYNPWPDSPSFPLEPLANQHSFLTAAAASSRPPTHSLRGAEPSFGIINGIAPCSHLLHPRIALRVGTEIPTMTPGALRGPARLPLTWCCSSHTAHMPGLPRPSNAARAMPSAWESLPQPFCFQTKVAQ